MTRARIALAALAAAAFALACGAALGGTGGTWTRVTDTGLSSIDEVALARTGDGVLHALWRKDAGTAEEIRHTSIGAGGQVGAQSIVAFGFLGVSGPDVILSGGGLRVLFGAIASPDELSGVRTATAGADGATWMLAPGRVSSSTTAPEPVGAAATLDGSALFAWAAGTRLSYRSSLDPAVPDQPVGFDPACCTYDPDIAVDAVTGEAVLAFYSNVTGSTGTYVRPVAPALGSLQLAPGSATGGSALSPDQRTPIVARTGGGLYLGYCGGYPVCTKVLVWRVGSASPLTVASGQDVEAVGVAAGADGRVWALWEDAQKDRLYASRSNEAVTVFGKPVVLRYPSGADTVWKLGGEGSLGPGLDVLAHAGPLVGDAASWHTQVLPGLTLKAKGGAVVSFTVTDAGDPVAGAKITVGGKTLTTDAAGKASADLPAGKLKATASRAGYTSATVKVRST